MLQKISAEYNRAMTILYHAAAAISSAILLSIFVVMTTEVLSRYFFRISLAWVVDYAQFGLVWLVFIGGSCLVYLEAHIAVDAFHKYFSPKTLTIAKIVFNVILLYLFYVLTVYGYQNALMGKGRMSASYLTDMYYPRLAIPIGSVMMALQVINNLLKRLCELIYHTESTEG